MSTMQRQRDGFEVSNHSQRVQSPKAVLRLSSNPSLGFGNGTADAFVALDSIMVDERHQFWPDDLSFGEAEVRRDAIRSHAQITDKYLAALARRHIGSLATFDQQLAQAFATEAGLVMLIG